MMIELSRIEEAARVLAPVRRKTELIHVAWPGDSPDFYIKPENLQVTGSFKLRGAYYAMFKMEPEARERGILAVSAGNHAQGVALAAQQMGVPAVIVMPRSAPLSKIKSTGAYGAEVILQGDSYDEAYAYARELEQSRELTFLHPFNDPDVIAGQGTVGLEILEAMPDVQAVVVPVGGGGLAAGVASAIKQINPACRVYGVQAENSASMFASLQKGRRISLDSSVTIADGIAVRSPGELTFDLCRRCLDGVFTVSDEEISGAILTMLENLKLVAEGAGAASVAALLFGRLSLPGQKTVAIVSGGNIDVNLLARIIDLGLKRTGRKMAFYTEISDKPGMLGKLLGCIARTGANLVSVHHDRVVHHVRIGHCVVEIILETSGETHMEHIQKTLREEGYAIQMIG